MDSQSLFDTITTPHETKDFLLRQAVTSLRKRYEVGDISVLRWIAGKTNPAEALAKRGASTSSLLSKMCTTGKLSVDLACGMTSIDVKKPLTHAPSQAEPLSPSGFSDSSVTSTW